MSPFDICEEAQGPCVHVEGGVESPCTDRKGAECLCTHVGRARPPACTDKAESPYTRKGQGLSVHMVRNKVPTGM